MASFPNWERQLLKLLGAPVTGENLRFLSAWQRAEGGAARFNPLNTTQGASGAGKYNSVGVRNYRNAQQGLNATARTLLNGRYGSIVNGLRSGASAGQLADALSSSPWGTSGKLVHDILGTSPQGGGVAKTGAFPQPGGVEVPKLDTHALARANLSDATAHGGHFDPMSMLQNLSTALAQVPARGAQTLTTPGGLNVQVSGKVDANVHKILALADHALGTPYVWGGESPKGFDCSGLLQFLYSKVGVKIPRVTYDQWKVGTAVGKKGLRAGDAVFFKGSDSKNGLPGHVGIYIGGGRFIEAPHSGAVVRVSKLAGRSDYMGARRYK